MERKRAGLTQLDLAQAMNSQARSGIVVSKWERETTKPSAEALNNLFRLGFDVQYILTGYRASGTEVLCQVDQ